ncbi:hypothetical protein [Alkalimonas amylolytica]|uniref:Uncharacterized protein n=1 Tax=Alkalimonas amylolytica TaxID=152573 RepID=A0A1H4DGR4_ALKAM|nr:hypothetical protein [Alkalimonas amylolytica]SEA71951.1 hypothetical protein SAMN04488051_105247 [Alkalimonas amylolytica]
MKAIFYTAVALALTGCSVQSAEAKAQTNNAQSTRIILMQDGERQEWQFSGRDWQDSAEWRQLLDSLEPERQEKLKRLLSRQDFPPIPPIPPMPRVHWQDKDGIKQLIIRSGDDELMAEHILDIRQRVAEHKFEVIRRMLEQTELNREQLQSLQQLLDSKH